MTTQLDFYGGPIADHLAYYGIPKSDVKNRLTRRQNPIARPDEIENFSQPHYELFHEWRLSPRVTLNNTFFYVTGDGFFDYDGSWAPYSYYRIGPAWGIPLDGDPDSLYPPGGLIRAWVSNKQFGWLPRLTLKQEAGELVLGAEIRVHRSNHWGRLQWAEEIPAGVPDDYHYYEYNGAKDILSLYANESLAFASNMEFSGSVQYIFNRYRLYNEKFIGTDFTVPYNFVNPRAGVNYNIDDHWNMYISGAYTSREPRLNNLYNAGEASTPASWGPVVPQFRVTASGSYDFSDPLVKPESLFDFEFGTGYRNEGTKATLNLYWMEFLNEIINSGQVDRFGQPITGNARRSRHIGVEFSGSIEVSKAITFGGNATLSSNRLAHHTDYSIGVPVILDGNPIAGFPDVLGNLRVTYTGGPLRFSWIARYVGRQYTDNFKNEDHSVDPSFVCNATLSWKVKDRSAGLGFDAMLQVNNIFDVLYAAHGEGDQFFVGAERNAFFQLTCTL
jgi:iron complex outermembrane receptor protein